MIFLQFLFNLLVVFDEWKNGLLCQLILALLDQLFGIFQFLLHCLDAFEVFLVKNKLLLLNLFRYYLRLLGSLLDLLHVLLHFIYLVQLFFC